MEQLSYENCVKPFREQLQNYSLKELKKFAKTYKVKVNIKGNLFSKEEILERILRKMYELMH